MVCGPRRTGPVVDGPAPDTSAKPLGIFAPRLVQLRAAAASGPAACRVADGLVVRCDADPRCADATVLTFSGGRPGNTVGTEGPFLFGVGSWWEYDLETASQPGDMYPQAIRQSPTTPTDNDNDILVDQGVTICRYMLHAPLS